MIDVGPYVRQGAMPHGPLRLGDGKRTVAQAGCLLSCLVMCARAVTPQKTLTVMGAQAMIDDAAGFLGSSLRLSVAAKALGMVLEERAKLSIDAVRKSLDEGCPVILGVDYKPGASSGFSDADHFILAVEADAGTVRFVDPATGLPDATEWRRPIYRGHPADFSEMVRVSGLRQ